MLELGLEVEMSEHPGYERHAVEGRGSGNSRNGTRTKTLVTDVGPVAIDVPRDRAGTFEPKTVRKRQVRLEGVDAMARDLRPVYTAVSEADAKECSTQVCTIAWGPVMPTRATPDRPGPSKLLTCTNRDIGGRGRTDDTPLWGLVIQLLADARYSGAPHGW